MNHRVRSLAEHFRHIALAQVDCAPCLQFLENSFRRFGPVRRSCLADAPAALACLLPLKSFTTRYLVFEVGGWCLCITDMIGQSCFVDVYALSRFTRCVALAAEFGETQRSFRYIANGELRRAISCYRDGDQWFFDQMGPPLEFEMVEHYTRGDRAERLPPNLVTFYLMCSASIRFPIDVRTTPFSSIHCVERSLENLRVPLEHFPVSESG